MLGYYMHIKKKPKNKYLRYALISLFDIVGILTFLLIIGMVFN